MSLKLFTELIYKQKTCLGKLKSIRFHHNHSRHRPFATLGTSDDSQNKNTQNQKVVDRNNSNLTQNKDNNQSNSQAFDGSAASGSIYSDSINQNITAIANRISHQNQNRLSHLMQLYEDVVGLTEVKLAQEKVVNAEQKFLQVQEDRRAMQQELLAVQAEVRAVGAELEKTSRTDSRYIDLVKKEHEALLIEKEMNNKIKALDKAERDFFALLSAALRESHEKERARAEKTKYWSIIGSVVGAIIGIIGSTFNNYKRMKELRAIVTESGENTAQYKDIANKMVQAVFAQQSKIEEYVVSLKNLELDNDVEKQQYADVLLVNHKDLSQQTEKILTAQQHQSELLLKQLSDIKRNLSIVKAQENSDSVVYVGSELEQMFQRTEEKLETELHRNRLVSAATITGLIVLSCLTLAIGKST